VSIRELVLAVVGRPKAGRVGIAAFLVIDLTRVVEGVLNAEVVDTAAVERTTMYAVG